MDVRQFAFLARQPSATLKRRDAFLGLPKRGLALILVNALFWQPLLAQAEGIVVSAPGTTVGAAGNGVPVVNIATPNGAGLSHNQFQQYNVGPNGVILNNATGTLVNTQLGGYIVGNPNLKGGAASVILNEVNGGSASQLRGYTEVAGQSAKVIVANPYGITCSGCGFINTPNVTLTTGKPIIDSTGQLKSYQVDGGAVTIDGEGLNASNVDRFDIITRSAKINAQINARELNVIAGRNDVDAQSLKTTVRADDGSAKPELAIDSSALGGMYAGAIKLVGTEAGVGVKLDGTLAASGGDIQLDANGRLSMVNAKASEAVVIKADQLDATGAVYAGTRIDVQTTTGLSNQKSLAARDSISLTSSGQVTNNGIIEAGVNGDESRNASGDVNLKAASLQNTQSVVASRTLKVTTSQALNNQGGTLSGVNTVASAGQLDNRGGRVLGTDSLKVNATGLDNRAAGLLHSDNSADVTVTAAVDNQNGRVIGLKNLTLNAGQLTNDNGLVASQEQAHVTAGPLSNRAGEISAQQTTLSATSLDNRSGKLLGSNLNVTASGAIDNRLGIFSATSLLTVQAASLDNSDKGSVASQGNLTATISGLLDNRREGNLVSQGAQQVSFGQLNNAQAGLVSSKTTLALHGDTLTNQGGLVIADGALALTGGSVDNSQKGVISSKADTRVELASLNNGNGGQLSSDGRLTLNANQLDNSAGRISAKGDLLATVGLLNQQAGELVSDGALSLVGNSVDNRNGGFIAATNGVDLRSQTVLNQQGEISSQAKVLLVADQLNNSAGKVIGDSGLTLTVQRLLNQSKGLLAGRDSLVLSGGQLDNSLGGRVSSQKDLNINLTGDLLNQGQGTLLSEGVLTVKAGTLDNRQGGILSAANALSITTDGQLNNQSGKLLADGTATLVSAALNNSQGGVISAKQQVDVRSAGLNNSQRGSISSDAGIILNAGQLDNSQQGSIFAKSTVKATLTGMDQHDHGELVSNTSIDLDMNRGQLINRDHGLIATPGQLLLSNLGSVDNSQGGEISSTQSFLLAADAVNNQGGKIISGDSLQVRIAKALDNSVEGVLSAKNLLQVEADSLDNQAGGALASRGALDLKVTGVLDNHNQGLISAATALTATSGSLNNSANGRLSAGTLHTLNTGALDNSQGGQLVSDGSLTVTAADVDNRSGVIGSQHALNLTVANLDNGAGLINSQSDLTLVGQRVDSSLGGEISSKGDLKLTIQKLIQRQGRLIGERAVTLDLQGGDLNNNGGLISAKGPLTFARLANLSNRKQGEISSQTAFSVAAKRIDNGDRGVILSADQLRLEADAVVNADKGLISGWNGLTVVGGSLDNSAEGTLSSKSGTLQATLTGTLDNHAAGALVSQGMQTINAANLNNDRGIISGQADVSLTVTGRLDNSNGGLISAAQQLGFNHAQSEILNRGGQISAANITLIGQSLDNSAGQLISQGTLEGTLSGALINANNARLASGAALLLNASSLDNRGGQLVSQDRLDLTLANGDLDNRDKGTLASQKDLVIKLLAGDINNQQDGLIFSQKGKLDLAARTLNNQKGTLQSQTDNQLRLSGALNNQGGRVDSLNGNLDLQTASVANTAGGILNSSKGWIKLVSGLFDNGSGITQAQSLDITAKGGLLNQLGHLSALSGENLIVTSTLNNQGGGVYADTLLKVTAQDFDNQGTAAGNGGKVGARTIDFGLTGTLSNRFGLIESDDTLGLSAQTISNVGGTLRAMGRTGSTRISTLGLFDNRLGALESANEALNLQAASLDNNGGRIVHTGSGTFDLTSDQVTRAGGSFVTSGQLDIKAASWTNSSVIQAGRLNLDIGQFTQTASGQLLGAQSLTGTGDTWTNEGLLASDGTLNLTLTGGYSGNGRVSSLGGMTLTSARMDLGDNARIAGGALTQINSTTLNNRGRLTSVGDLTVNANTLNNYGTLGGAEKVRLNATHLLNDKGLIFSGNDMTLRVNDFSNRYGDVYSLGGLDIARDDASGRSTLIENVSGTLESSGNMRLLADTLSNRRDQFSTEMKLVSGSFDTYYDDFCDGKGCEVHFRSVERYEDVVTGSSPTAYISSGAGLTVGAQTVDNLYSSMSAAGNIQIDTGVLNNIGAAGGEDRHFDSEFYTRNDSVYNTFITRRDQFNLYNNPNSADYRPGEMTIAKLRDGIGNFYNDSSYVVATAGRVIAPAVIQAAGSVTVNATQQINNSVIRANATDINTPAQNRNTNSDVFASTVKPAITAQLPPDLAQRQVNPVTLPGFSLPTGQNGLFRLSGQAAKAGAAGKAATGSGDFSVSGRVVSAAEREKTLDYNAVQERGFSLDGQPVSGAVNGQGPLVLDSRAPSVTRVQGVPDIAPVDNSHKYLIETNPALTDLKQFMSSDYLLGKLGYNPDTSWKRLGDGLYEQRLIREAVVARTGQRYINGIASDDQLFRYLMDNAISYKDSLNLQLGVSLTAEQVAALTHDIVWMEEAEVNGQKVLTPVLYLAQANNRLAPNGALIQGQDVSLISGGDLHNSGTLRATNNLSMVANNIDNSGLMQAGNRLEMLATDSIRNSRGGIITGRDISATAVTGDIINERTVTTFKRDGEKFQLRDDVVSDASRFEATDTLRLNAGRDVLNVGSTLKAGGNASVTAGRDVVIASQTEEDSAAYQRRRVKSTEQTLLQHGSSVEVGGNLAIEARRDIAVIASTVSAAKDLSAKAGENLTLSSAANEQHDYSKGKKGDTKTTTQLDNVTQQSAELKAGGDLIAVAGTDLTLVASKISAGNEAYVHADNELQLLAAQDSNYSLYDMSKKGGWGSKKTQRDEVTDVKNIGSEIKTGGDLTLESGGNQKYQAAKLDSGGDIAIVSGGAVTFEAVKDLHQESHEKSKGDAFWTSSKGKGNTDETLRQTQMVAEGNIAIKAVEGLKIDVNQVNQQTVSQSIEAMVKADPQLAWIKDAEARGDVDWRQVKEIHDSFKYSNSGLGPASQIIIAIVMAAVVGPLAAGAAAGAGAGAGVAAGAGAVAAGAATNATVSVVNNRGNLGAVLKDVTSSDAMKGYVIAGVTAGMTAAYFGDWTGTQTNTITGKVTTPGLLNTWSGVGKFAANQTLQSGTSMLLSKALGQGGSASDALKGALFNTLAAASFNLVGNFTEGVIADGSAPKIAIHAMVGGLLSEATGGDFKTGALAAGANEALVTHLDALVKGNEELLTMSSQIVGVLAAAGQTDADAATLEKGKWIAQNSTQYNYLSHNQLERAAKKIAACTNDACIEDTTRKFKELSIQQDLDAIASCRATPSSCATHSKVVANTMADLDPIKDIVDYGSPKAREAVQNLINSNYEFQEMLATATTEHSVGAMVDSLKAKWGLSDAQAQAITDDLKVALAAGLGTAAGVLAYKRAVASAGKSAPIKNHNPTSDKTDSETGTLVERSVLETSPKVINQAEPEVLAKVNKGRSPYSELNGAIGEARGWSQAIESGQTPISGPGKASLPGADYITYDPSSRSVIVWDAKYRAPGGSYPTSLPDSKLQAWQSEIINSVKNMPEGSAKAAAESALKAGRVEGRIFKWPQ
ncbi:filamentous hemagglutinin N-terminal domain-containing protein [Pseudomonas sp. R5-89-07]|uniref:two-partner secretion domain-containing protein n=1 Tax=Pseudomonas sp. R5-89-07 TaxID=658644 RepID=UPI000F6DF269|nr:filamentous hemagglutinin N-terminal domain-containing protein [Pseudomonas sp. R5-89-07]AZF03126.1 Putative large exoprotein, ShlA/HecA/FhaA family [Pseudomonas sp. R5-89-07]